MYDVAILVCAFVGAVTGIITVLPILGFNPRIRGRLPVPLEHPDFAASAWRPIKAWLTLALSILSLCVASFAAYRLAHPRVIEKIVDKPVDRIVEKVVPGECPAPRVVSPKHSSKRIEPPSSATATSSGESSPPIGSVNQGPGSAFSNNQQGGITAGTVTITAPPDLSVSASQAQKVSDSLGPGALANTKILISVVQETIDMRNSVLRLKKALESAGATVEIEEDAIFAPPVGVSYPSGLSFLDLPKGYVEAARKIAAALKGAGVVTDKIPVSRVVNQGDYLEIHIERGSQLKPPSR